MADLMDVYRDKMSLKESLRKFERRHPTLFKIAAAATEIAMGAYLEAYGSWTLDFASPETPLQPEGPQSLEDFFEENPLDTDEKTGRTGVPLPFVLKMVGVPRKYWFLISRFLSWSGAYLLYKGAEKLGYYAGIANHSVNEGRLRNPESDDDLFNIYYSHEVDKILREHTTVHRWLSNATRSGMIGYLLSQTFISAAWAWKYKYGLAETDYGIAWNNVYHLISLPSLFAIGSGRFYDGTIRSEKQYDYEPELDWNGERIVREAVLLKGIDVFRKLDGKRFDDFVEFLRTDFLEYQERKMVKEERWCKIKNQIVKGYAVDGYLANVTRQTVIEDLEDLYKESRAINNGYGDGKYILFGKKGFTRINLGRAGRDLLDKILEGSGFNAFVRRRYLDKKLIKDENLRLRQGIYKSTSGPCSPLQPWLFL